MHIQVTKISNSEWVVLPVIQKKQALRRIPEIKLPMTCKVEDFASSQGLNYLVLRRWNGITALRLSEGARSASISISFSAK